jgi:hypothetical protein
VGDRLLTASLEYEETGWYDGQVFVKPPEVLTRDRLLGTYEVKPVLARLRCGSRVCEALTSYCVGHYVRASKRALVFLCVRAPVMARHAPPSRAASPRCCCCSFRAAVRAARPPASRASLAPCRWLAHLPRSSGPWFRCRTTLQGVGVGLMATAVTLTVLINSQLDADGAYGVPAAPAVPAALCLPRRACVLQRYAWGAPLGLFRPPRNWRGPRTWPSLPAASHAPTQPVILAPSALPLAGRGSARKLAQVTPAGILYSDRVKDLSDLAVDDEAAELEAAAQVGDGGRRVGWGGVGRVCGRVVAPVAGASGVGGSLDLCCTWHGWEAVAKSSLLPFQCA